MTGLRDMLGAELSPAARTRLVDAVLFHTDDAVVLSRVEEMSGTWCPTVVYVNPGFSALLGYGAEEVHGQAPGL